MNKTARSVEFTDFESEASGVYGRTTTIGLSNAGTSENYFLEATNTFNDDTPSQSTITRLTRRELMDLGKAMLEQAGAQGISFSWVPTPKEED